MDIPFPLVILWVVVASAASFKYLSFWFVLCLSCQRYIGGRDEFLQDYDKFAQKQLSKLLEDSSEEVPTSYKKLERLYQTEKSGAYRRCVRYLLARIAAVFLVFLLVLAPAALDLFNVIDLNSWYAAIPSLVFIGSMRMRLAVLSRDEQFYTLPLMKAVLKNMDKRSV